MPMYVAVAGYFVAS